MQVKRIYLLFWCASIAIFAYVLLDFWNSRNAPLYKRFERQWADDVHSLEASPKLPKPWFDVREVEIFGGTPESKKWLRQIKIPVGQKKANGEHKLEVLIVPWVEEGKTGVMIQYNLVHLKSQNMIFELGRTLILNEPRPKNSLKGVLQDITK